jgi:hypothetical protein
VSRPPSTSCVPAAENTNGGQAIVITWGAPPDRLGRRLAQLGEDPAQSAHPQRQVKPIVLDNIVQQLDELLTFLVGEVEPGHFRQRKRELNRHRDLIAAV